MHELVSASEPYLPFVLGTLLLLYLAPLVGRPMRTAFGTVLLLGAAALLVVAWTQAQSVATLDVVNPFPRAGSEQPHLFLTDKAEAPGWAWPALLAAALAAPGGLILLRRRRAPAAPSALTHAGAIGLYALLLRLGLEKTAAPIGLAWTVGLFHATFIMLPFLGGYAGACGLSFARFMVALVGVAMLHRLAVVGISYVLTTQGLGTHLDVGSVTDIEPPLLAWLVPEQFGEDPVERWFWAVFVLQMVFWVPATAIMGAMIGTLPWAIARRRLALGSR
ncbi:MAG: hypothetical protein AAF628_10485 [Planctomycetota bacterium]